MAKPSSKRFRSSDDLLEEVCKISRKHPDISVTEVRAKLAEQLRQNDSAAAAPFYCPSGWVYVESRLELDNDGAHGYPYRCSEVVSREEYNRFVCKVAQQHRVIPIGAVTHWSKSNPLGPGCDSGVAPARSPLDDSKFFWEHLRGKVIAGDRNPVRFSEAVAMNGYGWGPVQASLDALDEEDEEENENNSSNRDESDAASSASSSSAAGEDAQGEEDKKQPEETR